MKALFTLKSTRTYRDRVEELSLRIKPAYPGKIEREFVAIKRDIFQNNTTTDAYIKDIDVLNRICKQIFEHIYIAKTYGEYDPEKNQYYLENILFATKHYLRIDSDDLFTIEHKVVYCDVTIDTIITGDKSDLEFLENEGVL